MSKTFHHPDDRNTDFINRRQQRARRDYPIDLVEFYDVPEEISPVTERILGRVMKKAQKGYRFLIECDKLLGDLFIAPTKIYHDTESRQSIFSSYTLEKIKQLLGSRDPSPNSKGNTNNTLLLGYTPKKTLSDKEILILRNKLYAMLVMLSPTQEQLSIQKANKNYRKWIDIIENAALTKNYIPDSIQDNGPHVNIPKK